LPIYVSKCGVCNRNHDYFKPIDLRHETPMCCDTQTQKIIVPVEIGAMCFNGHKGFHLPDGKGPNMQGTYIETGAQYKKYMRDNNKIPHDEYCQELEVQKKNREAEDDKKLTKDVERAVAQHTN
jgi:hypothetical protein